MSSKHNDFYKSYISKLQTKTKEAVQDAQKKAFSEYFEVADKKIREIYKSVITDFYKDYTPRFYDRRDGGSLYQLIQTKCGDDYLQIGFNPSRISYRNGYASEDGLYETVFRQGWHGGAMVQGSMLYPIGKYENGKPRVYDGTYKDGVYKPYDDEDYKYSWTIANKAAISPLEDFKKKLNAYQESEYQQDYEKIWNKHKSNIKIDM